VGFVVDKVALWQVFLRVRRFSPLNIIPPLLHIHPCIIWGLDNGPIETQFHTDIVSTYRKNNKIEFAEAVLGATSIFRASRRLLPIMRHEIESGIRLLRVHAMARDPRRRGGVS
jgi:hypothetical protein